MINIAELCEVIKTAATDAAMATNAMVTGLFLPPVSYTHLTLPTNREV